MKINEKRLFTKELEMSTIKNKWSCTFLKNILITNKFANFILGVILKREDSRDVYIKLLVTEQDALIEIIKVSEINLRTIII